MKEKLLTARDVCKRFTENDAGGQVLTDISLDLYSGDFTVVMGASGAGKSTLLYVLSGMDTLTGGTVLYRGNDISTLTEKQTARMRSGEFGFVFQQTHLVSSLTLFENVAVAGYLNKKRSTAETRKRAGALLEQMHVGTAKDRLPSEVSGGEAQRAALARALINHPHLLFADEPTGALNRHNTEEVLNLLTEVHNGGQSILMVTHDVRAALHGNRILYLEDGMITGEKELGPYTGTGEKELGPYTGTGEKEREAQLTQWLTTLGW